MSIKIYASYKDSIILGMYSTDVWDVSNIPSPNIEISAKDRDDICSKGVNNFFVVNKEIIYKPMPNDGNVYIRQKDSWVEDPEALLRINEKRRDAAYRDEIYPLLIKEQMEEVPLGTVKEAVKDINKRFPRGR